MKSPYHRRRAFRDLGKRLSSFKWTRGRFYLIGFVIFFFLFVAGRSGFYAQFRLWQEGRRLEKAIETEQKKKIWLKNEAESLANDRQRIEREARKEHGLGESDEIIVKIRE